MCGISSKIAIDLTPKPKRSIATTIANAKSRTVVMYTVGFTAVVPKSEQRDSFDTTKRYSAP